MSEVMVKKERPIIFSGYDVQAILDRRKTQFRRVMKGQPYTLRTEGWGFPTRKGGFVSQTMIVDDCPYGKPGDRLWCKEAFVIQNDVAGECLPFRDGRPVLRPSEDELEYVNWSWKQPHYRATDPTPELECFKLHERCAGRPCVNPWLPARQMKRWASRITLEITDVRVQRVQDISEEDAAAEGSYPEFEVSLASFMDKNRPIVSTHYLGFKHLWQSIHGPGAWERNEWVRAISFEVAQP